MKIKNILILGAISLTGFILARYILDKNESEEKISGLLTPRDIERLYSMVKL